EIAARSHRDLRPLLEEPVDEEVRPLVHAVNDLLGRLKEAYAAQSRFLANAAHQLRTPLAGLRTQVQLAKGEPASPTLQRIIDNLDSSADRTTHLAHQLLTLARAEP